MDTPEKAHSMEKFIQRHNIAHYEELLKAETDQAKRATPRYR
jgi:hypothetical protein